jgi:hypothetical protein
MNSYKVHSFVSEFWHIFTGITYTKCGMSKPDMAAPFNQSLSVSKDTAVFQNPTSSFTFRFHEPGQPNVFFRKKPDLTSDPNQVWVALDNSEIKFVNYTPDNMPNNLETESPQEDGHEMELPSPKRQKSNSSGQRKTVERPSKPTTFRVDKPVQANVPPDVWRTILKESHPAVLLIIKNLNRQFHALLQEQSIWRASRFKLHGEDVPAPPAGMTEQRYAHLLYGQGCDFRKSKCGSTVTKKVYWPFLLRMCDACFRRKTVKVCRSCAATSQELSTDLSSRTKRYEGPWAS